MVELLSKAFIYWGIFCLIAGPISAYVVWRWGGQDKRKTARAKAKFKARITGYVDDALKARK